MNIDEIQKGVERVMSRHPEALSTVASSQTKLLELAAVTGVAEHFKDQGFVVTTEGLGPRNSFRVKTTASGYPWNFSRFRVQRGNEAYEIHMNLKVRGAHDEGIYCVDVAVIDTAIVPQEKPKGQWLCAENEPLRTFVEVKKLNVYPMLLAQFFGIVHEITPEFVDQTKPGRAKDPLLEPALAVLGSLSGNSASIIEGFADRGLSIMIAYNYDLRLMRSRLKGGSPFAKEASSDASST